MKIEDFETVRILVIKKEELEGILAAAKNRHITIGVIDRCLTYIAEEEFKKEIIESIKKEIKRINNQLKELGVEM